MQIDVADILAIFRLDGPLLAVRVFLERVVPVLHVKLRILIGGRSDVKPLHLVVVDHLDALIQVRFFQRAQVDERAADAQSRAQISLPSAVAPKGFRHTLYAFAISASNLPYSLPYSHNRRSR